MRFLFYLCALLAIDGHARADGDWVDSCTRGPFVCRSEFRLADKQALLRELDRLKTDIEETLDLEVDDKSVEINLFLSKRNYVEYVSKRVPDSVGRQALYVKGPDRARIYVYRHRDYHTDLRHECTHALLHHALPFLPLWLDEGLAEYFEVFPTQRVGGHQHLKGIRWAIRFGWKPSLEDLENKRILRDMKSHDYRDAWAWVHFMLHESPQSRSVFIGYLNDIKQSDPPGPLSIRLKRQIPNAEAHLLKHFRSWRK